MKGSSSFGPQVASSVPPPTALNPATYCVLNHSLLPKQTYPLRACFPLLFPWKTSTRPLSLISKVISSLKLFLSPANSQVLIVLGNCRPLHPPSWWTHSPILITSFHLLLSHHFLTLDITSLVYVNISDTGHAILGVVLTYLLLSISNNDLPLEKTFQTL